MVVRGQRLGEGRKSVKTKVTMLRRRVRSMNTMMMMRTMFCGEKQFGLSSSARPRLTPRLLVRAPPALLSVISLPSSSLQPGKQIVFSGEQIRKVMRKTQVMSPHTPDTNHILSYRDGCLAGLTSTHIDINYI